MTKPSELLADITTCMVPVPIPGAPGHFKACGQKFTSTRVTIIGEDSQARVNNYMAGLMKHLHAKHPQVGIMMTQHGAAFMELLFLRNFKTTDPELTEMQDRVRWQVHQQTLKARYPDENLGAQAESLGRSLWELIYHYTEEIQAFVQAGGPNVADKSNAFDDQIVVEFKRQIAEAFRSIRDALEEPGKYEAPVQGDSD